LTTIKHRHTEYRVPKERLPEIVSHETDLSQEFVEGLGDLPIEHR